MFNKNLVGIDEVSEYTKLLPHVLMDLKNFYDLPLENHSENDGIWRTSSKQLEKWLAENGLQDWRQCSVTRLRAAKLRKMRQGPGKILQGDMVFVCDRLQIATGTFITLMQRIDCPIKHVEDTNQYLVDLNRWEDFRTEKEDHPRDLPW
jgi:hypothetical protein